MVAVEVVIMPEITDEPSGCFHVRPLFGDPLERVILERLGRAMQREIEVSMGIPALDWLNSKRCP